MLSRLQHAGQENDAIFADYDNDGRLDLFVVRAGANILYRNLGEGNFLDVTASAAVAGFAFGNKALCVDLDHEGDLDLFVAGSGANRLYRNNGDGTFAELAETMGLAGGQARSRDAFCGDFDEDGDIDLFVANENASNMLYSNLRQGRFQEVTASAGWTSTAGATAVAGGDYDNEGAGRFQDVSTLLPQDFAARRRIAVADYHEDGDQDIFVAESNGRVHLLRNDGGNANHCLKVQLVGLRTGSGKNNHFGIGAKLEVRAGAHYQMRVVEEPVTHFGLGPRLQADVVRIVWTNGAPQNVFYPDSVLLFLQGWIFPSGASINVAVSQSQKLRPIAPYLQVPDKNGQWHTVVENVGFPLGKNKTVVADLTGKLLSDDYRLRLRTNMEIYWDHIFFTCVKPDSRSNAIAQARLHPRSANLHYRGFSQEYRKGGRYGPHWFDYSEVSMAPKWRDLEGFYTRYGDVTPLLLRADDQYVIMNSGDEVTVEFDATGVPALPPGWSRDYLIYSVGWIKDGDLNTAHGKTVEPLPFHGMPAYPYGPDISYPQDEEHRRYLQIYNTRKVTTERFRKRVSHATFPTKAR